MGQVEFLSAKSYSTFTLHYAISHHISYLNIVLYCCFDGALNSIFTLQDNIFLELI